MTQAGDEVIAVRDLTKVFKTLRAVDGISFSVRRGEVFGILGPNGAGKTTALECIEGLQKPTSGSIEVLGIDAQRQPVRVKERIGVQLQASAYFDYLTLREILELFGRFYPRRIAADELLRQVELLEKANTPVGKLSGGQKQRFTIAAALVNDPEMVFLDEPTTGLDPQARRNLWDFIQQIHRSGRTVVLTTHYMEEAESLCHRVAIMDHGKIVALDTPRSLIHALAAPYEVRVVINEGAATDALADLEGVVGMESLEDGVLSLRTTDATRTLPRLLAWASESGAHLSHLEVQPANLEDVFLSLTGHALRE